MAIISREKASTRIVSEETKNLIGANRKYTDLKFTVVGKEKDVEKFIVSTTLVEKLDLKTKGFRQYFDDGTDESGAEVGEKAVYLAVTSDEHSTFMKSNKKGNKGRTFTSTHLRDDLTAAGLLPAEKPKGTTVKFDLVEDKLETLGMEEGNELGVTAVYKVVPSADQSESEEDQADKAEAESTDESGVAKKGAKKEKAVAVEASTEDEFA